MGDFAVDRWKLALAEELDALSYSIKSGACTDHAHAEKLRRLADILERAI